MAAELRTNKSKGFRVDGNATTSFTCASRCSIEQTIEANIGGRKQDDWFQDTNSISDMVESNALKIVFFDKGEMGEVLLLLCPPPFNLTPPAHTYIFLIPHTGQAKAFEFEQLMEVALEKELGAGRHGGWSEDGAATLNATGGGGGGICAGPRKSLFSAGVKWEGGGCGLLCGKTNPLVRDLTVRGR
jgi:hypothetical protein